MVHQVNKESFLRRATQLYTSWEQGKYGLSDVDCLMVILGPYDDNYNRTLTFQVWLHNNELLDTLVILTRKGIFFLASNKKADYFLPVASDSAQGVIPPVKTIHRNKVDKDAANFDGLIQHMRSAGNRIGHFAKDKFSGDFFSAWMDKVNSENFQMVDMSAPFTALFAVKDSKEIDLERHSASAAVNMWTHLRTRFVEIVDQEKKVKHSKIAGELEADPNDVKIQGQLSKGKAIETAYTPIIMSGGDYSFKWNTESNDKVLHYGCIISSLGLRYESYCSNVTRTMLVNPSKNVEEAYEKILVTELELIQNLKPGAYLKDVYAKTIKSLKERDPALEEQLHKKEFGFVTGVQFREGSLSISAKSEEKVKPGMVFVVYIGVSGIRNTNGKDDQGKKFAIAISDTVLVSAEGPNEVLTEKAKSRLKSCVLRFKEEPEEEEKTRETRNGAMPRGQRSVVINDQTRNKATNEDKRKEHQKELMDRLNETAKARLSLQSGGTDVKKVKKSNVSYKSYEKFPQESDINKLNIYVDKRHDSVVLPIFGVPVPFHISMIKNCSQSVEGDFTYLRINFTHPGSQIGKDTALFPKPLATYLKELTFRATNVKEHGAVNPPSHNLTGAYRLIKEMQKNFRTEEAEEREKEGAVKQDKLILSQGKANPKLKDLLLRPAIVAKKISGTLEAHTNGFRYTSMRGDRIDVLYNNIKHAFFQPCDNEMIILLHFHLKNPVMWGKKKYKDIQFYSEVGEITTDLGKYHHMQDRDDVQSEQMEREMRRKLNQTFQNFCDKVQKQTNDLFDFDTPFSELGFHGAPYRSSVILKPTSTCLVNLTEWPPFIVTLDEAELVHFERVSFALKNFDMVFIFKDYNRKVQMVNTIPTTSLDSVKEWLNSCDIKYNEGIQSLNWTKIMKTIVDDPDAFFDDGGWSFLNNDSDDEQQMDESESEDAYSPTDEGGSDEEESDEDESEGEVTTDEDSEEEGSLGSDESEGKDWSDLEEEAAKADKRREVEDVGKVGPGRDRDRGRERDRERDRDRKRHGGSSKVAPPHKRRK